MGSIPTASNFCRFPLPFGGWWGWLVYFSHPRRLEMILCFFSAVYKRGRPPTAKQGIFDHQFTRRVYTLTLLSHFPPLHDGTLANERNYRLFSSFAQLKMSYRQLDLSASSTWCQFSRLGPIIQKLKGLCSVIQNIILITERMLLTYIRHLPNQS